MTGTRIKRYNRMRRYTRGSNLVLQALNKQNYLQFGTCGEWYFTTWLFLFGPFLVLFGPFLNQFGAKQHYLSNLMQKKHVKPFWVNFFWGQSYGCSIKERDVPPNFVPYLRQKNYPHPRPLAVKIHQIVLKGSHCSFFRL